MSTIPRTKGTAAIVGPGNIGTDLHVQAPAPQRRLDAALHGRRRPGTPTACAGPRDSASRPAAEGVDWLLAPGRAARHRLRGDLAKAHAANAPRYAEAGHPRRRPHPRRARALRLPAGQPRGSPRRAQRQHDHLRRPGHHPDGPRGRPRVVPVPYAEIVASIASRSAGPGTRANIDEFTETTSRGPRGGRRRRAGQGDHHPQPGRAADDHAEHGLLRDPGRGAEPRRRTRSSSRSTRWSTRCRSYVPGYHAARRPAVRRAARRPGTGMARVAVFLEVGATATTCPHYAGNLDIITAAAARVGDAGRPRQPGAAMTR